jgi:hypothetical protein
MQYTVEDLKNLSWNMGRIISGISGLSIGDNPMLDKARDAERIINTLLCAAVMIEDDPEAGKKFALTLFKSLPL